MTVVLGCKSYRPLLLRRAILSRLLSTEGERPCLTRASYPRRWTRRLVPLGSRGCAARNGDRLGGLLSLRCVDVAAARAAVGSARRVHVRRSPGVPDREPAPRAVAVFLLKARDPAKYLGNVKVADAGPVGGPVELEHRGVSLADLLRVARDAGLVGADGNGSACS